MTVDQSCVLGITRCSVEDSVCVSGGRCVSRRRATIARRKDVQPRREDHRDKVVPQPKRGLRVHRLVWYPAPISIRPRRLAQWKANADTREDGEIRERKAEAAVIVGGSKRRDVKDLPSEIGRQCSINPPPSVCDHERSRAGSWLSVVP